MNEPRPAQATDPRPGRWRAWGGGIFLLTVALLSALPVLDQRAAENYDDLFQRAVVTFALARTLNGVISAAQGTEVALQPAGVGVTLTPGQILDPVNDLVERFSWIMLGATVSLGIQNVLLEVSAWWVLQGLVVVLALGLLLLRRWPGRGAPGALKPMLWRGLFIALFLRFAVPLSLMANEAVYELFLESRYEQSTEIIQTAGRELEQAEAARAAAIEERTAEAGGLAGMLDALGDAWDGAMDAGALAAQVQAVQERAAGLIEHLIQLSVVFVLQTGILPVAFLWLFLRLARWLIRPLRPEL